MGLGDWFFFVVFEIQHWFNRSKANTIFTTMSNNNDQYHNLYTHFREYYHQACEIKPSK